MKTIWKYDVQPDEFALEMPRGTHVIGVQVQHGKPRMWALVDPSEPVETRRFLTAGTGHELDRAEELRHAGTFQMCGGDLVLHLFERVEDPNAAIGSPAAEV
jgi:hypothetical protein